MKIGKSHAPESWLLEPGAAADIAALISSAGVPLRITDSVRQ